MKNYFRDGNTRPPYLPPEKSVCRSRSNSGNNRLCQNWGRRISRLYIVTLLFNVYTEYIMRNARLDDAQAGIKIARRNINNLRYADDTTLMVEKWRGTKELLDERERGEWKSWLKTQHSKNEDHGIWSRHFLANRWGNSGNSDWLLFWAPKSLQMVIAAMKLKDTCSLEENLWPI